MSADFRPYRADPDYLRVRQFVIDTFALYDRPYNWLLDRWNFCRYFVLPVHTYYNVQYFGVPTGTEQPFRDELPYWEQTIGIWEDGDGEIVGVVHSENEEPGEATLQIHPDHMDLYDEMLDYAETHLMNRYEGIGYVKIHAYDGSELAGHLAARNYRRLDQPSPHLEYHIGDVSVPSLPDGFAFRSVAEQDDVDKRRVAKALAFGQNYNPTDWPPASAFRQMQQAPDYRPELDLFIEAPNGDYASFCTIWLDEANGYGQFEPVGTHPDYQRMGLATALLQEGFLRMAERGISRSFMESNNPFYRRVGFQEASMTIYPWIKYWNLATDQVRA
jgi:ribosomal protein S18 acetylase RimI-like enzyme